MGLERDAVRDGLVRALAERPFVLAIWEGGSAAWARDDRWSDLDLQLFVEDERVDDAIAAADEALAALSPVELRFAVPQPTWHGHAQVFYRLRDTSEFLLVDLAVMKRSTSMPMNERERHGERRILLDRCGEVGSIPLDVERHARRVRSALERLRVTFPLFQSLTRKELLRGNELGALGFYRSHTFEPLLTLLRIRHCPERFDFGPKYALFDLPDACYEQVRELAFVADAADLEAKRDRAERLFEATLREIDAASPQTGEG